MLFTFPSRYLFTIGRRGVLRLGGWSPHVQTGFHVSRPTRVSCCLMTTGLSPTMADLSRSFVFISQEHWPGPGSLATTTGVSVDVLSSGYGDVSVPRVCSMNPMYSGHCTFEQPTNLMSGQNRKSHSQAVKVGFPIQKCPDQRVLAPPRTLSQRATSFIASLRHGIRQKPFNV